MAEPTAPTVEAVIGADKVEDVQRFIIAARAYAQVADTFQTLFAEAVREIHTMGISLDDDGVFVEGSLLGELYDAHAAAFNAAKAAHGDLR